MSLGQSQTTYTRPPSILDVVRALKSVAPAHAEVRAWWYAPLQRLRLAGEQPQDRLQALPVVEVALQADPDQSPDSEVIARELAEYLAPARVTVRRYRGRAAEDARLFRLLSRPATPRS